MRTNSQIEALLNKLVGTYLTRGVQPSDLADAAFEDNYRRIEIVKGTDGVCMTVSYLDDDEEGSVPHEMRYVYGMDRYLMRVEQRMDGGSFAVQWDRERSIDSLLKDTAKQMKKLNSKERVSQFFSSVPEKLRANLKRKLRLVA
ncbi:hypothetical protein ACLEPN_22840 [Myxococcus sp. 1LA]